MIDKKARLAALNQLIEISKQCSCPVADVYFGWGFDVIVIMSGPMPGAVRSRIKYDKIFDVTVTDYDPHYGGWTSYNEHVVDRQNSIAIVFPRPPEELDAHKAEMSRKMGRFSESRN